MSPETTLLVWLISVLVGVGVLYLVVRFAVAHGTTSSLRRHEAWMRDGSLERYLDKHTEVLANKAQQAEVERKRMQLNRWDV